MHVCLPVYTNVCVTCLCLLGEMYASVCFEAGWDVWFITLIGRFQTAELQKVKEGEEERDDEEKEA